MKKAIVFGGVGFLGYYLVKELIKRGYQISVADIRDDGEFEEEVTYLQCDILNKSSVDEAIGSDQFDVVYNLAGFANLDQAVKNPYRTMELNVLGNINVLDLCRKYSIPKFIYASSAYAVSNKGSFYGISKLASEKIIEEYHKKFNLSFVILRYGSIYSEKNYDNNYIFSLVEEAIKTGQINHKGDGHEIREYIHAADAAKLSVDVNESDEFLNSHVILTGTERMERMELFNMINEILDGKISINCNHTGYDNHYRYTPYSFEPSVSKKLVANPHIDMGQGLLECVRTVYKSQS